ncbi:MAG: hypothetical protein KDA44_06790 [Planctomycetales bacterium]|nr:hypothetical protein [Planctomycetales bacterium]
MKSYLATALLLTALLSVAARGGEHVYACDSVDAIEAALAAINKAGVGGSIGIMPGTYRLKSPYRKSLEKSGKGDWNGASKTYALYVSSPNVTIYSVVPGAARLLGEKDAIVNTSATGEFTAFRGGMIYLDRTAANATIRGLDLDGGVKPRPKFNKNVYNNAENKGVDCWDWGHKAINSISPNARILDCQIHNWAGEMVYGGQDGTPCRLEIRGCRLYDNQVSAMSGDWQLNCHNNEFFRLDGQCMEGLHNWTCSYRDNYFHDCKGGGLNIMGPVTKLAPKNGWWIEVRDNIFERMASDQFGCVYLSRQTTPDVSNPSRIGIVGNTFRDCRTALSVSLGVAEEVYFADNLILVDQILTADGIASKSGHFFNSMFCDNTFMLTQNAADRNARLNAGALNTGLHGGARFVGNLYERCRPPADMEFSNGETPQLCFVNETYKDLEFQRDVYLKYATNNPGNTPLPTNNYDGPISVGVLSVQFQTPWYLRMATTASGGKPLFPDGTELRLTGNPETSVKTVAYLCNGRGCQLQDDFPVFLGSFNDYVLLRYSAAEKIWLEVERSTPTANRLLKLSHRGKAADAPLFGELAPLVVEGVNVLNEAVAGWPYYETDTGAWKYYTGSAWNAK